VLRLLEELDEYPPGGTGVKKRDEVVVGTAARCSIDQFEAAGLVFQESGLEIRNTVAKMVQAGPSLGEETAHGGVGAGRRKKLDSTRARSDEDDFDTLALDSFPAVAGRGEDGGPDGECILQGSDGDADVIQGALVHRWSAD
jgi:hypothetical protein